MSSLIFLAFCSNKKRLLFFDFNNLTRLIRILSMDPSVSLLTGFDCIIYINHNYDKILKSDWLSTALICIGNSMVCSDIWHKYHE